MPFAPPVACKVCGVAACLNPEHARKVTATATVKPRRCRLYDRMRWKRPLTGSQDVKLRLDPMCADPFNEQCHQPATQVHHKVDHHGNEKLFWDFNNLQSLCHSCHSRITGESHGAGGKNIAPQLPALDASGRIQNQS